MKKIRTVSETFNEENFIGGGAKVKQIVHLMIGMMAAGNLQGCDSPTWMWSSSFSTWVSLTSWTPTAWWTLSTLVLIGLVSELFDEPHQQAQSGNGQVQRSVEFNQKSHGLDRPRGPYCPRWYARCSCQWNLEQ